MDAWNACNITAAVIQQEKRLQGKKLGIVAYVWRALIFCAHEDKTQANEWDTGGQKGRDVDLIPKAYLIYFKLRNM